MNDDIQGEDACLSFCTKVKKFKRNEYSKTEDINRQMENVKPKLHSNRKRQNVSAYRRLKKSSNSSCTTKVIRSCS